MVVVIDYNMGNIASVEKAFRSINAKVLVSNNKNDIEKAQYLVLPGVGAFGDGMKNLQRLDLVNILNKKVLQDKTPFLGICLGMQLIADLSHEFGTYKGLGWVKGQVVKLKSNSMRLPHIGWNNINILDKSDPLFKGVTDDNFYFVHSYHLNCEDKSIVTATCDYGKVFTATIHQYNIFATQFHPEKSQDSGLCLLQNFLDIKKYA
ncbi:imidazole glycerol phosphate synthase subunit HisH [Candidatus Falkowbacteria bacterium CG10_big_fil_rev_8_21_14_0_10_44_15]|uniref:Imidazole glycerol phosphate synthase subunit HisH n=1 Tax=Candidatus Falkowbacteria bacterium CG10_big_fil_rev_8_21_14_0_10_44_15 TaxID=1974569 RepID=A0A2H0UZK1_9BACT|nr:MAG: imidazole glycerol phosphate synthase subunit HisH [Candidatus Falkowbacteria bacterium CG10_big_fil_rev_8_21_14_0_10_44_15]